MPLQLGRILAVDAGMQSDLEALLLLDAGTRASNNGAVIDLVPVEPGPRVFALCR